MRDARPLTLLFFPLLFLSACGRDSWRERGAVVERTVEIKARGIDVITVHVCAPNAGSGAPATDGAGVVLVSDTLTSASRYQAFARSLCAKGLSVAVPEFPFSSPSLAPDNAEAARRLLARGDSASGLPSLAARAVSILGHASGGDVATRVVGKGEFASLLLFGSAPSTSEVDEVDQPVLFISGGRDCEVSEEEIRESAERFRGSVTVATAQHLSHRSITDSLSGSGSCKAQGTLENGHALLSEIVVRFIEATLSGDDEGLVSLGDGLEDVDVEVLR